MSVVSIVIKIDILDICNNVSVFRRIKMKELKKPFLVPLSVLFDQYSVRATIGLKLWPVMHTFRLVKKRIFMCVEVYVSLKRLLRYQDTKTNVGSIDTSAFRSFSNGSNPEQGQTIHRLQTKLFHLLLSGLCFDVVT